MRVRDAAGHRLRRRGDSSAVIIRVVLEILTVFVIVRLRFALCAGVGAAPTPPTDVAACDIAMSVLDEGGVVPDALEARVVSGQAFALQY